MDKSQFDLEKFRQEFLQSDGWKVSDCYKPHNDKFLRKDAQDAYEGAKWAWKEQQKRIDELCVGIRKLIEEYKSEEKELELKEWEQSTIYGRIAIELEEALKGGED